MFMKVIKSLFLLIARILGRIFYDPEYLRGRYFGNNLRGWIWVVRTAPLKLIGYNLKSPWPVDHSCEVTNYNNIIFDVDDMHIFHRRGTYFQCTNAKIIIGKGTQIAYGVGLITENHDLCDITKHQPGKDICIGKSCWIGMNAVLLPGIILGDHTVVGAGSVVTKSFPDGYVVVAGNPAKVIKTLNKADCVD